MKINLIIVIASFCTLFISCNNKQRTIAKIFERKEIDGNKLMIKYSFITDGKSITDSTIIDNKVINGDSIFISYDRSNPSETTLQLPE
jgi:hypothetical protein